jgi:hypothetical protein
VLSDLRVVTGWIAYAVLAGYWLWIISSTAPQLRRSRRDRGLSTRILAMRTAGIALTAFVVGMIHFWAANPVEVLAALGIGGVVGTVLRREYRRLVAAPRHRLNFFGRIDRRLHGSGAHAVHPSTQGVPRTP